MVPLVSGHNKNITLIDCEKLQRDDKRFHQEVLSIKAVYRKARYNVAMENEALSLCDD